MTAREAEKWNAWIDDLPVPPEFYDTIDELQDFISALTARVAELEAALYAYLHRAEVCLGGPDMPMGGQTDKHLAISARAALAKPGVSKSSQAAKCLLESIVYYDLAERRGELVADAIIDELAKIADAKPGDAP